MENSTNNDQDTNSKSIAVGRVLSKSLKESKSTLLRDFPMQVSPQWAEEAMCVTSTSLEISLDQLRNLYFKTFVGTNCEGSVNYDETNGITITFKPKLSGDVDAKSINDQDEMRQYWEQQIATGEIRIVPPEPETKIRTPFDTSSFVSNVETPSIADINQAKLQWEKYSLEMQVEKENTIRKPKNTNGITEMKKESAMGREIRLTEEREKQLQYEMQLRNEKSGRLSADQDDEKKDSSDNEKECFESSHRKNSTQSSLSSYDQLDSTFNNEFDSNCTSPVPDSLTDKDIRTQLEREKEIDSLMSNTNLINKEYEQSEYERQEKEHERINAHESFVERDIRIMYAREKDLDKQRKLSRSTPNLTDLYIADPIRENTLFINETHSDNSDQLTSFDPTGQNPLSTDISKIGSSQENVDNPFRYENIAPEMNMRESVIAREIREQRERELELRKRWNDMGLKSEIDHDEQSDTPYNRPNISSPIYVPNKHMNNHIAKTSSQKNETEKNMNQPDEVKVPLKKYVETPIERDIRLVRERENDLRKSKGLGSILTSSADEISLDVKGEVHPVRNVPMNKMSVDAGNMKRLTTQRFQKDIEKSKEKDESFKHEAIIKATSEQSSGPSVKYTEVIKNEKHGHYKALLPNRTYQTKLSSKLVAVPQSVSSSALNINDQKLYEPLKPISKSASHTSIPNGITNQNPVNKLSAPMPLKGSRSMDFIKKTSSNNTESKIEQELREQKEREDDLRRQRHGASNEPELNSHSEEKDSLELPRPMFSSKESDNSNKRRKSALAAEWEKKFSGNL